VSMFTGQHDHVNIKEWHLVRHAYFDMTEADLRSSTTDSGSNVRKAMLQLLAPWFPCTSHFLHKAVRYALGQNGNAEMQ